jgi:hypothetical protein
MEPGQGWFHGPDLAPVARCGRARGPWQTDGGLRAEYTVTRVVQHIPGARDVPLPFENGAG